MGNRGGKDRPPHPGRVIRMSIPWQVAAAIRGVLDFPGRMRLRKERSGISRSSSHAPVLSFGGVLERREFLHGGAIKLLHLRDAFPASAEAFNILYLVSSAPPPFARDLWETCRRRGIKFVWNQNGVAFRGWAGAEAERFNGPMRWLRDRADYVVYQSGFCRMASDEFLGPADRPASILFNPVDLEKFSPAPDPLPVAPLRLLSLGTHSYPDRVLSAVQCLSVLRKDGVEAMLTIAGKMEWPGAADQVRAEIRKLGLENAIRLLPAFTQDEAVALYRSHHIVLHPKYLDPCPTVVIEALACGLPVVGSASGGLPEMVPADCGSLIPVPLVWDRMITPPAADWAASIKTVIPQLSEFSKAARQHAVQHFKAETWVAEHRRIFESLIA